MPLLSDEKQPARSAKCEILESDRINLRPIRLSITAEFLSDLFGRAELSEAMQKENERTD